MNVGVINSIGVVLSVVYLLAALVELLMRSDRVARYTGMFLVIAASSVMLTVVWSQMRQREALQNQLSPIRKKQLMESFETPPSPYPPVKNQVVKVERQE